MATLLQLLNAAEKSIWKTKGKDQAKNAYRMVSTLGPALSLEDLTTQRLSDYFQELRKAGYYSQPLSLSYGQPAWRGCRAQAARPSAVLLYLKENNKRSVTWRTPWFTYLLEVTQANGAQLSVDLTKFIRLRLSYRRPAASGAAGHR